MPARVDEGATALQNRRFVEQHADALAPRCRAPCGWNRGCPEWHRSGRVDAAAPAPAPRWRPHGDHGFWPEVAGRDADVVAHLPQALDQRGGIATIHVQVQVAEMKQGEIVQGIRQVGNDDFVVMDLNGGGVADSSAV